MAHLADIRGCDAAQDASRLIPGDEQVRETLAMVAVIDCARMMNFLDQGKTGIRVDDTEKLLFELPAYRLVIFAGQDLAGRFPARKIDAHPCGPVVRENFEEAPSRTIALTSVVIDLLEIGRASCRERVCQSV